GDAAQLAPRGPVEVDRRLVRRSLERADARGEPRAVGAGGEQRGRERAEAELVGPAGERARDDGRGGAVGWRGAVGWGGAVCRRDTVLAGPDRYPQLALQAPSGRRPERVGDPRLDARVESGQRV